MPVRWLGVIGTATFVRGQPPLGAVGRVEDDEYPRGPGAVAEWTKATVLKTVDLQGSVGSNPTRSASFSRNPAIQTRPSDIW